MINSAKRQGTLTQSPSLRLGIVSLFVGLAGACVDTVWSAYLDSFFHSIAIVGLVTGVLSLFAVVFYFFCAPLVERYLEAKLWPLAALIVLFAYIGIGNVTGPSSFLVGATVLALASVLMYETFGIIVRDSGRRGDIGKIEGALYALNNIGWVVGPLIGGFVAARLGFSPVFFGAAVAMAIALALFVAIRVRPINHHTLDDGTVMGCVRNMREFFSHPELRKVYLVSGGMKLYWAIVYVYVPLLILRSGIPIYWIGIFLFSVALPLIVLEYPVGAYADRTSFRPLFLVAYAFLALAGLAAFFAGSIYTVMLVFFIASIGAACLEGTRESYFFKITLLRDEQRFYGPYMTHGDVFSTVGKLMAAAVAALFAPKYIFLLLFAQMLAFMWVSSRLKERHPRKDKAAVPLPSTDVA